MGNHDKSRSNHNKGSPAVQADPSGVGGVTWLGEEEGRDRNASIAGSEP